ncbi:MAG: hypothetical protein EBS28_03360, partial [Chlamydiae bacterium]|nr:hypothetical protein [Chlamydiota bacterium]
FNLSHFMSGQKTLQEIIVTSRHGVMLVPGASGVKELASLTRVQASRIVQAFSALEDDIDYLVVDKVLTGYIEESKTVEQIAKDTHIEKSIVEALVKKIYMAESKRRQSAPPLRVSVKSFGIGRRKPLTLSTKQIDEIY